jgi:choloylglycine hydrolase
LTPNVFWVNLKKIDFSEKAPVKKLSLEKNEIYAGDALDSFKNASPFKFQGL